MPDSDSPTGASSPPPRLSQVPEVTLPPPAPTGGSIAPPSEDNHPVLRLSKWVGAIIGLLSAVTVVVTGVWRVGGILDDLDEAREDLASLRESVEDSQEENRRRNEIQEEILQNLRNAVSAIQAVAEYRSLVESSTHRTARPPRTRPPTATLPVVAPPTVTPPFLAPTVPGTSPGTLPVTVGVRRRDLDDPPSPEVAEIVRRLPPMPTPPPESFTSGSAPPPPEVGSDFASDSVDVALERIDILLEAL